MGRQAAHWLYLALVVGAYIALTVAVLATLLPTWTLLAMLSLPLLVRQIRSAEFGASGQQRAIAMIDLQTAQLHAAFGYLMVGRARHRRHRRYSLKPVTAIGLAMAFGLFGPDVPWASGLGSGSA
jgi:hypothetical protein